MVSPRGNVLKGKSAVKAIKTLQPYTVPCGPLESDAHADVLEYASRANTSFARVKGKGHHGLGVSAVVQGHEFFVGLPLRPTLSFSSARTLPDLRLQVASLNLCTTPDRPTCSTQQSAYISSSSSSSSSSRDGVSIVPSGVLLLAYFMFPDQAGPVIRGLAWPGAAVLTLPLLRHASSRMGLASKEAGAGLMGGIDNDGAGRSRSERAFQGCEKKRMPRDGGWRAVAQWAQEYAGSAAVLRALGLCCLCLSPSSTSIVQASLGLATVMVEYNAVGRKQRKGLVKPGPQAELAWRNVHKRAAQRLAKHLPRDMPSSTAPLAPVLDVLECLSSRTTTAGSAADAAVGACMGGAAVGQGMWGSGMGLADTQGLESHAAWLACLGNWDGREHGSGGSRHPWSMQLPGGSPILSLSIPLGGMPTSRQEASKGSPGNTAGSSARKEVAAASTTMPPANSASPTNKPQQQQQPPQPKPLAVASSSSSAWSPTDDTNATTDARAPRVWQQNLVASQQEGGSGSLSRTGSTSASTPHLPIPSNSNPTFASTTAPQCSTPPPLQPQLQGGAQQQGLEAAVAAAEGLQAAAASSTQPAQLRNQSCPPPGVFGQHYEPCPQDTGVWKEDGSGVSRSRVPVVSQVPLAAANDKPGQVCCAFPDLAVSTPLSPPKTPPLKTPTSQPTLSPDPSPCLVMPPSFALETCLDSGTASVQEQVRLLEGQQQQQQQQLPQQQGKQQQSRQEQQQQQQQQQEVAQLPQQRQQLEELQHKQRLLAQHLLHRQMLRHESRAHQYAAQELTSQGHQNAVQETMQGYKGVAIGEVADQQDGQQQQQQRHISHSLPVATLEHAAAQEGQTGHMVIAKSLQSHSQQQQHHSATQKDARFPVLANGSTGLAAAACAGHRDASQAVAPVASHQDTPVAVEPVAQDSGTSRAQGPLPGTLIALQASAHQLQLDLRASQEGAKPHGWYQQQPQQQLQRQSSRAGGETADLQLPAEDATVKSTMNGQHMMQHQEQQQQQQQMQRQRSRAGREAAGSQFPAEDATVKLITNGQHSQHQEQQQQQQQQQQVISATDKGQSAGGARAMPAGAPILLEPPHLEHAHSVSPAPHVPSAPEEVLPLFGQADHLDVEQPQGPVSWTKACANTGVLCLRALYLMAIFAPFLLLGVSLLLTALGCSRKRAQRRRLQRSHKVGTGLQKAETTALAGQGAAPSGQQQQHQHQQDLQHHPQPEVRRSRRSRDAHAQKREAALQRLSPEVRVVLEAVEEGDESGGPGEGGPWLWWLESKSRQIAWSLLLFGCRKSGAALIKWGQWAAARPDLFPADFCDAMATLQDKAPVHSFAHTKREVEAAFGAPLLTHFSWFDPKPLASGSIAQVHRATVRDPSSNGNVDVVVKVRHPGVATSIFRDFQLLKPLASFASRFRALKGLSLRETVSQFSHTMTAQADLRVEAVHIARFARDFAPVWAQVAVPRLFPGLVHPAVLVESFESGRSVAHFTKARTPINTQIVSLGVDAYLAMLLKHNFVHTDLHPGNILVRMHNPATGRALSDEEAGFSRMLAGQSQFKAAGASSTNNSNSRTSSSSSRDSILAPHAQIILLDFGLAEELTPRVRRHFVSFLNCIAAGDGVRAAEHILQWGMQQNCPDPGAFITAMEILFEDICRIDSPEGIDLDRVMKMVLSLASKLQVTVDSSYAALAIGVCVLVGFATSLDSSVNLMDAATPCLLAYALTGRVVGRLYA